MHLVADKIANNVYKCILFVEHANRFAGLNATI